MEKKHTDPAEKAFISTLCLLKEGKKIKRWLWHGKRLKRVFHLIDSFQNRQWLLPLRELTAFKKMEGTDQSFPSYSRAYGWSGHRRIRQFWFRTDGQCEIGVEVTGHSDGNPLLQERKTDMLE